MTEWWNTLALDALDAQQWEALCDGCARCCLHKLQDADTEELFFTRVRCRYLKDPACRCTDYANRTALVPHCVNLHKADPASLNWLPQTCAYRLRAQGRPLPEWHYLVSGDRESVHLAGISVRGRTVSDEFVHPDGYDEHVVNWVE